MNRDLVFLRDIQQAVLISVPLKSFGWDKRWIFCKRKLVNFPDMRSAVFGVFIHGDGVIPVIRADGGNNGSDGQERREKGRDHLLFHDLLLLVEFRYLIC